MAEAAPSNPAEGATNHGGGGGGGGGGDDGNISVREQDRFLPIANIIRIMKKGLPNQAKVSKDAKDAMQECVSEFIAFITSEATQRCMKEKRKTITGEDVVQSMATLGFEDYIQPLKLCLEKYRASECGEGSARREMGVSHPNTNTAGEYQVLQQNPLAQYMNYANHQFQSGDL